MFYNETMINLTQSIVGYIKSLVDLNDESSNVLMFFMNENISSFLGNSKFNSIDVNFTFEGNEITIKTIFDRSIKISIEEGRLDSVKLKGECLDDEGRLVNTFLISMNDDKFINECTYDDGSMYNYFVDTTKKDYILGKCDKDTREEKNVIKASPLGTKLRDRYFYELEKIMPKPDVKNGSILKKFVDLVRSDSLMKLPLRDLADDFDLDVLFSVFEKLKEEIEKREKGLKRD